MNPSDFQVLVVDDEEILCEVLQEDLEDEGFRVLTAHCGKDAFDIVKTQNIDLVVSDVRMPNGTGIELLENIRAIDSLKPVVMFLSGQSDITDERAFDMGVDAILSKPTEPELLLATIQRLLTPLGQRWQVDPDTIDVDMEVTQEFTKFTDARDAKQINVGRGGFFLAIPGNVPKPGVNVAFRLAFADQEFSDLQGVGVVRWRRASSEDDLLAGVGIEFLSVQETARASVIKYIENHRSHAYIPRT